MHKQTSVHACAPAMGAEIRCVNDYDEEGAVSSGRHKGSKRTWKRGYCEWDMHVTSRSVHHLDSDEIVGPVRKMRRKWWKPNRSRGAIILEILDSNGPL